MKSSYVLFAAVFVLGIIGSRTCLGYTIVQVSTGAPAGTEQQFLSASAKQFNIKIVPNPLASNTYAVTLYGINPNFNPPVTQAQLLQQIDLDAQYMANEDTSTFINGFADGMTYQQDQVEGLVGSLGSLCGSPTSYALIQTNPSTFNSSTCQDVVGTIENELFQLSLSTPTTIPPEP